MREDNSSAKLSDRDIDPGDDVLGHIKLLGHFLMNSSEDPSSGEEDPQQ